MRRRDRRPVRVRLDHDAGTITPLILVFFLVGALLVMGASAAGGAFLAQRDVQSSCDAAALAAANAIASGPVYRGDPGISQGIPLAGDSVDSAAARVANATAGGSSARPGTSTSATTDGHSVGVTCRRTVRIPFGTVFGFGAGLPRSATSHAVAPARDR